ncbi:symmetrical bis(5'-nucleosyl)-tetraphosphatase [Neptunomonas japonica]|uniref:Bis(5'-nucleosyl)-tetraphosphatase, symmetrical n=1 Tax=Neptunomonas japonica JAMM 1380 TaxID=1441457 RepID=A0A7R6PEN9_9GAMM|nr:symmetrical bis(5'-nucleosyl)-tetraphosphatase [Neptunomonas japonica]BBB28732.1 bis(5'-nucleosyl)-tetraphosphatase (symmetrical) [Neptunomonas japonica JAMM 1380]
MATYAIGDIQGCFDELQNLLAAISFNKSDTLWICGDLVNRGPKSLETLRFIKQLDRQAISVLGNHDLHLLAIHNGAVKKKKSDTLDEILNASDRSELMDWLQQQPLLHSDKSLNFTMVHAGIPPRWSITKAHQLANEVESTLKSPQAKAFFEHMYGNTPKIWSNQLSGWDRLRLITNYFTRMRFCTSQNELEFASKGGLETQPNGFLPWYKHDNRKSAEQRIVFGHWAALQGKTDTANIYALDTGCIWGDKLTALRLDDLAYFETPSLQKNNF